MVFSFAFIVSCCFYSCSKENYKGYDSPLAINSTHIRINATNGTTKIPVFSDGPWKVTSKDNSNWLKFNPGEGNSTGYFVVEYESNAENLARATTLLVQSGSEVKEILFEQRGKAVVLNINEVRVIVTSAQGSTSTPLTSNVPIEEISYNLDFKGELPWVNNVIISNEKIDFSYIQNESESRKRAVLNISYMDALGELKKDSVYIDQNTILEDNEIEVNRNNIIGYRLPTDAVDNNSTSNPISKLFDNKWHEDGTSWYRTLDGQGFPQHMTIDLGETIQLTRMVLFQRGTGGGGQLSFLYNNLNIKDFEVWGSTTPNPNGSWDGWNKLGTFTYTKPSGTLPGTVTAEDLALARVGHEFFLDYKNHSKVKYIRIKVLETWGGANSTAVYLSELKFYGMPD